MKSLLQKINQLEGLIDTKDVDEATNNFLVKIVRRCRDLRGDTTWLSPGQVDWLERIYERHFA